MGRCGNGVCRNFVIVCEHDDHRHATFVTSAPRGWHPAPDECRHNAQEQVKHDGQADAFLKRPRL
jgi:hypothetical protein